MLFVAGWCPRCGAAWLGDVSSVPYDQRYCSHRCEKKAKERRRRRRRRAEASTRLRAPRDLSTLFDVDDWCCKRCPACGKYAFPTFERAAFRAPLFAAGTGRAMKPYFDHGLWHLTSGNA